MTSRDERYRAQAMRAEQKADRYRSLALDLVAALVVSTGDIGWLEQVQGEDVAEARGRVESLRGRMVNRSR